VSVSKIRFGQQPVLHSYDNTTKAIIGEGAQVYTGSAGGLAVEAYEDITTINLVYAGTKAGKEGATFTGGVLVHNSTTLAQIDSGAIIECGIPLDKKGNPKDSILLQAESNMLHVNTLGALQKSKNLSVGVTFGVNVIDRDTAAFIGRNIDDANQIPAGTDITADGKVSIKAVNKGTVATGAIAGAISSETPAAAEKKSAEGNGDTEYESGIGFAGDAEVHDVNEVTRAYVNDSGASIQAGGDMDVVAASKTSAWAIGGAVALSSLSGKSQNGNTHVGLAGSFAYNEITLTTKAFVDGANLLIGGDLNVEATLPAESAFVTLSAGLAGTFNQPSDVTGVNVAGSFSYNLLDLTTTAKIDSSTLDVTGSVTVKATDQSHIVAIGGAAAVGATSGFGLGVGINEITGTTSATVVDSDVFADGGLEISATTGHYITGVGVSVGHGNATKQGDTSIAFGGMVSINIIDTTTQARLMGSNVVTTDSGADVRVTAVNSNLIIGVGGAFAVAGDYGLGAGVIYNEIRADVFAFIDDSDNNLSSTVDAAGDVLVQADNTSRLYGISLSASVAENSLTGSFVLNKAMGTIDAHIADSDVTAGGLVEVWAEDSTTSVSAAGGAAWSREQRGNSKNIGGVGVAMGLNLVATRVTAFIERSMVKAATDVLVTAGAKGTVVGVAAGISSSEDSALTVFGSLVLNWDLQHVDAHISDSDIEAGGDVQVEAVNQSTMVGFAGSVTVSGSGSVAFGASLVYNYGRRFAG